MQRRLARPGARGQIIPLIAIMVTVIVAFVALVIDGGRGYLDRRSLQSTADTAALSGAGQLDVAGRKRTDLSYARASAINEAVSNLPGTSVPAGYAFSNAGSGTPGVCATLLQCDVSGLSLGAGYTMDVQATTSTVTASLHHRLSLTFGVAAGFGPSITPGATATAENGGLAFALILFRNNATGNQEYGNLQSSGSGVTLTIRVAASAPAGTTGDAMTNESICPAPGVVDFGLTGDMYANKTSGWNKFPGSCGSASNVTNTKSGQTLIANPQIANPNYPEPAVGACAGALCGKDVTVNTAGVQCLAPGTYSSINVKKGTLVLLPGVFKIDDGTGKDVGFAVTSSAAVATADTLGAADLGVNGCPATVPAAGNASGIALEMVPVGAAGSKNQLVVNSGASFKIHGSRAYNFITVYVENSLSGDPCFWNALQGCGSSVVVFSSGAVYDVKGVVYGYGDNMTFGGGSGGAGLGQVFAWTVFINGNGAISETYDPAQTPVLQGLIN